MSEKLNFTQRNQEHVLRRKNRIIRNLNFENYDQAKGIIDAFKIPPEKVQVAARNSIIKCLDVGNYDLAIKTVDRFKVSDEVLQSEEVQAKAKNVVVKCLDGSGWRQYDQAIKIIDTFKISDEVLQSEEVQVAARNSIIKCLDVGNYDLAIKTVDRFKVSDEVLQSEEVQAKAKNGVVRCLDFGNYDLAKEVIDAFKIPPEKVQVAARNSIIKCLDVGNYDLAIKTVDRFKVSDEVLQSEEVQAKAKNVVVKCLDGSGWRQYDQAIKIIDTFKISDEVLQSEEVQAKAKNVVVKCLDFGNYDLAKEVIDKFKISPEEVRVMVENEMTRCLCGSGWQQYDQAIKIIDTFKISPEEVRVAIKNAIIDCLSPGRSYLVMKIADRFKVSDEVVMSIILDNSPKINFFISKIEVVSHILANKFKTVPAVAVSYFEMDDDDELMFIQAVENNPFIRRAVEKNPRYGIKLALKLGELDDLSKENIKLLYEVISEQDNVDPDTPEFRKLVQEKLLKYKNNPTIFISLIKHEINISEWLDYREEKYFDLGKEEESTLSERLQTPIFRIQESLGSYSADLKNILSQHKEDFLVMMVSEDLEEVRVKIEKLTSEREKALAENNLKKVAGIDKGVKQLQKKISDPKKTSLWEKIFDDLSLVDRVIKDVMATYNILIENEKSLQDHSRDQSKSAKERRKVIIKLKEKIENSKLEFVDKFKALETRITTFEDRLVETLTRSIGSEKADKIISMWKGSIAEKMNHFETDKTTITNIFVRDRGIGDNLDATPMAIRLWNRNPDVDLYLGNYTDCCIRIDSEHMGEESTIADYLTDLGMQVVTIYDEKRNIPIAAAWIFVGINNEEEVALVVDNIEANTDYSTYYKAQLENHLKEYLTRYTESVGLKKFVQGTLNNNLTIAGMDGAYKKLGGYNRKDGYFLEGESERDDDGENEEYGEEEDENN